MTHKHYQLTPLINSAIAGWCAFATLTNYEVGHWTAMGIMGFLALLNAMCAIGHLQPMETKEHNGDV